LKEQSLCDRLRAFQALLMDIDFVHSITVVPIVRISKAYSPFVPLVSMLFRTLRDAFHEKEFHSDVPKVLSILATVLEVYPSSQSEDVCRPLFALMPLIFTYYDALKHRLRGEGEIGMSAFTPILLFLMRHCGSDQLLAFWNLLSVDNQIRFLDFLAALNEPVMVVAVNNDSAKPEVLQVAREMTRRMVLFAYRLFKEGSNLRDRIFHILLMMLHKDQPDDSFGVVLRALAWFVQEDLDGFFSNAKLMVEVFRVIVGVTQRKLAVVRSGAIAWLVWICKTESAKYGGKSRRCNYVLQYAVCSCYFEKNGFRPFFDYLKSMPEVKQLYTKLEKAHSGTYQTQIMALLDVYKEYCDFPSIRAKIYAAIVQLNAANDDFSPAFVTQWRLCALIAQVFKLKGHVVDGIPTNGWQSFPFVSD
jgi:hypothetical protein